MSSPICAAVWAPTPARIGQAIRVAAADDEQHRRASPTADAGAIGVVVAGQSVDLRIPAQ
jgi:hypothetical protein